MPQELGAAEAEEPQRVFVAIDKLAGGCVDDHDGLGGVLDQNAVAFFTFLEGADGGDFGVAQGSRFLGATDGDRQARHLVLEDVVGDAGLDAVDREFIAQGSAEKNQGNARPNLRDDDTASTPVQPFMR